MTILLYNALNTSISIIFVIFMRNSDITLFPSIEAFDEFIPLFVITSPPAESRDDATPGYPLRLWQFVTHAHLIWDAGPILDVRRTSGLGLCLQDYNSHFI